MNPTSPLYPALLASGRFFFRFRNALFPAMLLAGQAFRLVLIGYADIRRGGKNKEVFANELVTRGFYAHTRNPMYVGDYLAVAGFALIFGSAPIAALVAGFFLWAYFAIGAAYDACARRVNRFIPDFSGLKESLSEFEFDGRRSLVKEYNTLCFTLAIVLGMLAWKVVYLHGYAGNEGHGALIVHRAAAPGRVLRHRSPPRKYPEASAPPRLGKRTGSPFPPVLIGSGAEECLRPSLAS